MSVIALTIEEMKALPYGTHAVLLVNAYGHKAGDVVVRGHPMAYSDRDEYIDGIAAFSTLDGKEYDYYKEGQIGLTAIQANTTVCAGRTCVDFSPHMQLFQPEPSLTVKTLEQVRAECGTHADAAKLFADLVPPGESVDTGCHDTLGIFRPELGTRKLGKVRVELVDHGFPRALREVAKVMTWAQTAKGYKDHDWQNLPDAEVALEAAASRHRTDHIEQRVVEGYTIERCVDHESGLLHKAHEAFGVLAQLELMLRGEFDLGLDSHV